MPPRPAAKRPARAGRAAPLRVVVTDVDGTLTDRRRRLDPAAVAAVQRVEERGIPVVLATGNVLPIALALHRSLGLSGPIVAENGGLIWRGDRRGEKAIERVADPRPARAAYRALRRARVPVRRLFTDRWRETEIALEPTVPIRRLRAVLGARPVRIESTGYAIHLIDARAGKAVAVARALAGIGRTLGEAAVLGDGDNDVDMLRAAGWSGSFPSGSARARSAAGFVSRAPFARGFVEGLKASGVLR